MRVFLPFLMLATTACTGDDDKDESGMVEETGPAEETGQKKQPVTYSIQASVLDAVTQMPVAEGLCAGLLDPTPVISGDDAVTLGTGTTDANGQVTFADITAKPTLGLLVQVDDCPDSTKDLVGIPTNTGVLPASYADAKDGETVQIPTFAIDVATIGGFAASAPAAGYKGDLTMGGFLFGFVLDGNNAPIGGATVSTETGSPTYLYVDADAKDGGLFASIKGKAPVANTATDPLTGGFLVADADIGQYAASADGFTFEPTLIGGFPGQAVVIAFIGTPASM
ncbi:MAG: hypothetical protein AAGA48_33625 [Myxococcota bacterium]